jgi:hypothetical protein
MLFAHDEFLFVTFKAHFLVIADFDVLFGTVNDFPHAIGRWINASENFDLVAGDAFLRPGVLPVIDQEVILMAMPVIGIVMMTVGLGVVVITHLELLSSSQSPYQRIDVL